MRHLFLVSVLFITVSAHALPGSPKRIHCSARGSEATLDIPYLHDLIKRVCGDEGGSCDIGNVILSFTQYTTLLDRTTFECDQFNGKVSTCRASGEDEDSKLGFSYGFNSQSGSLHVWDKASGLVVSSNWLNQHDVTDSGYLHTRTALKNYQGGLLGNPRLYELEVNCYASHKDWRD